MKKEAKEDVEKISKPVVREISSGKEVGACLQLTDARRHGSKKTGDSTLLEKSTSKVKR